MIAKVLRRRRNFALFAGMVSIANLLVMGVMEGWPAPLSAFFDAYNRILGWFFGPLEWFVRLVAAYLGLELTLSPAWRDVTLVLSLYFGARASAYREAGFTGRARFRMAFGFVMALITGFLFGITSLVPEQYALTFAFASLTFGIFIFDFVDAIVSATFTRMDGYSWIGDVRRYLGFTLPVLVMGLVFTALAFALSQSPFSISLKLALAVALTAYASCLSLYWLWKGWEFASPTTNRRSGETRFQRFKRSSNTLLASEIGASILGAILMVLFAAGL
jgi:hypothetical protein